MNSRKYLHVRSTFQLASSRFLLTYIYRKEINMICPLEFDVHEPLPRACASTLISVFR